MKLVRLKITDPDGFRSLPCGFEHHFRTEWSHAGRTRQTRWLRALRLRWPQWQRQIQSAGSAGGYFLPTGSIPRVRRSFLPEALQGEALDFSPVAFELDYLIRVPAEYRCPDGPEWAMSASGKTLANRCAFWNNRNNFRSRVCHEILAGDLADMLLPSMCWAIRPARTKSSVCLSSKCASCNLMNIGMQ